MVFPKKGGVWGDKKKVIKAIEQLKGAAWASDRQHTTNEG